jgi:hypothetical protein
MSSYEVMIGLCFGGAALSVLYCIAECLNWASKRAADRRNARTMLGVYAKLLSVQTIQRAASVVVRPLVKLAPKKNK